MPKYKKNQPPSAETIDTAMKIAKSNQRPNQTKEQTKLIAQGIQKGIVQYKKSQKSRAQEIDRLKKKITHHKDTVEIHHSSEEKITCKFQWLPWSLLVVSWLAMAVFLINTK